jgi:hypothetical protein
MSHCSATRKLSEGCSWTNETLRALAGKVRHCQGITRFAGSWSMRSSFCFSQPTTQRRMTRLRQPKRLARNAKRPSVRLKPRCAQADRRGPDPLHNSTTTRGKRVLQERKKKAIGSERRWNRKFFETAVCAACRWLHAEGSPSEQSRFDPTLAPITYGDRRPSGGMTPLAANEQ